MAIKNYEADSMVFANGRRYRAGERIPLDGIKPAKNMRPFGKGAKSVATEEAPGTFSEIAQRDGKAQDPKGADELV